MTKKKPKSTVRYGFDRKAGEVRQTRKGKGALNAALKLMGK